MNLLNLHHVEEVNRRREKRPFVRRRTEDQPLILPNRRQNFANVRRLQVEHFNLKPLFRNRLKRSFREKRSIPIHGRIDERDRLFTLTLGVGDKFLIQFDNPFRILSPDESMRRSNDFNRRTR